MRRTGPLLAGVLALALAGCDYVSSEKPFGRAPLRAEPGEWAGTWLNEDGALTVRVIDAAKGHLEVGWIEAGSGGLSLELIEAHLREFEGDAYASITGLDEDEEVPGYLWVRLSREGERLVLWLPEAESFARLVEEGVLAGRLEDGGVVLGALDDRQLALVGADDGGELFSWREPMVLLRVRPGGS